MIIKKEADRKFYNSETKKYITLNDIFLLVKSHAYFKVISPQDIDITKEVVKKSIMTHCSNFDECLEIMFDYFNKEKVLISDNFLIIDRRHFETIDSLSSLVGLLESINKKEKEKIIKSKFIPDLNLKIDDDFDFVRISDKYPSSWNLIKDTKKKYCVLMVKDLDIEKDFENVINIKREYRPEDGFFIVMVNNSLYNFNEKNVIELIIRHKIFILNKELGDDYIEKIIEKLKVNL